MSGPATGVAGVLRQLGGRPLISHAASLARSLSSRSSSAASADARSPAAPPPKAEAASAEAAALRAHAAPPGSECAPRCLKGMKECSVGLGLLVCLVGTVFGWVPLLVTGVVYYTHPTPGVPCPPSSMRLAVMPDKGEGYRPLILMKRGGRRGD